MESQNLGLTKISTIGKSQNKLAASSNLILTSNLETLDYDYTKFSCKILLIVQSFIFLKATFNDLNRSQSHGLIKLLFEKPELMVDLGKDFDLSR